MNEERIPYRTGDWSCFSIMVIDDNKNFLVLVKTILKALGLRRIQLVQDPLSAIDRLIKRPADLVFCDWEMEGMNGVVFSQKVKELELGSKVILLTSYSIETLQARSSNNTIEGYLEKPVTVKSLLDKISTVFNY
jgi:two-component SAPR family response regulator